MSTQSNTLTRGNQTELGLLVWLSFNKKWAYSESANSSIEKGVIDDENLKSAAFSMSSKTLQAFLEEEEEGSIF